MFVFCKGETVTGFAISVQFSSAAYTAVGVLLDCPKALMADVHVATVHLSERLAGPYHADADPDPGRSVAADGNLHWPSLPTGIALLANWQSTFPGKMP